MVFSTIYRLFEKRSWLCIVLLLQLWDLPAYSQADLRRLQLAYPKQDMPATGNVSLNGLILPIENMFVIAQKIGRGNDLAEHHTDSALALYRDAMALSQQIGYKRGIAVCLINSAQCLYYAKRDIAGSVQLARRALHYIGPIDAKDTFLLSFAYYIMGLDHFRKATYDSAFRYFYRTLVYARKDSVANASILAKAYFGVGSVLVNMNDRRNAIVYFQKAIKGAGSDASFLANVYERMASSYAYIDNVEEGSPGISRDSALYYYKEALRLYRLCNDTRLRKNMQDVYRGESAIWIKSCDFAKGKQLLDKAVAIYPEGMQDNDPLLMNLGYIYFATGNFRKALFYYEKGLEIARKNEYTKRMQFYYGTLAYIYDTLGYGNKAYRYQVAHIQLKDSQERQERIGFIKELDVKYRVSEKNKELAIRESSLLRAEIENQRKSTTIRAILLSIALLVSTMVFLRYRQVNILRGVRQRRALELLRATMEGEERERIRIGVELHDGIGGLLAAIKMNLVTLKSNKKSIGVEPGFAVTMALADEAADKLRRTAHNLVPDNLVKNGIGTAIRGFCERINISSPGINIRVMEIGPIQRLYATTELIIYRIIQELVQNRVIASGANEGLISLSWQEKMLLIAVEDNGGSVLAERVTESRIFSDIQKKLTSINGFMEIDSRPEEGISVYLYLEYSV